MPNQGGGAQKNKIVKNMGLFWRRDHVTWRGNRKIGAAALVGVRSDAKRQGKVNFWNQVGIYALYANYQLVYVGQGGIGDKSCVGDRLKHHTKYDLAGRWDMFSWFGLRKVVAEGKLGAKFTLAQTTWRNIADILEGVLIEIAEPPMNSQKGRFGKSVHRYLQLAPTKEDPAKTLADMQKTLNKVLEKVKKK
jgi:hypothetical protein